MGFFNRFKKQSPPPPEAPKPEAGTMLLPLFSDVISIDAAAETARALYGPDAVKSVDSSHPAIPALTLDLDGQEYFCSCFPMPQPKEVCDFSQVTGGLFSDQERQVILDHKSFLVLAQEGGGTSLADKRRICTTLTRFVGALMEREDAAGVYVNAAQLLISPRVYRMHAGILAQNRDDPSYFPAPLWTGIVHAYSGDRPVIATIGLRDFGFCELCFPEPRSEWPEVHQKLYLMSIFEITGKEIYKNMDTIEFTKGNPAIFKQEGSVLYIIGSGV